MTSSLWIELSQRTISAKLHCSVTRWRVDDEPLIEKRTPAVEPAPMVFGRVNGKPSRTPKHSKEYEEWHKTLTKLAEMFPCLMAKNGVSEVIRESTEPISFHEAVTGKYKQY